MVDVKVTDLGWVDCLQCQVTAVLLLAALEPINCQMDTVSTPIQSCCSPGNDGCKHIETTLYPCFFGMVIVDAVFTQISNTQFTPYAY